ncbi:phosphatase PAP2 family protein [Polaribacter sp. BAL334]|uniref:phosphatase PAP2 family protein n=1 Tax=Polaribacter sp. BAL334 TaxID=1708178 RepID=UPI0018D25501|nr:phosphatase PAP2 family protein [Polaribacter sp. BAL334]MBG7611136.1 phosphatase PAP2 family protein [Polaribacter sp. BAL334]
MLVSVITQNNNKNLLFDRFLLKIEGLSRKIRKETGIIFLIFILISVLFVSLYNKHELHLILNKFHTPFFDIFFKYITFLGDGVMFGFVAIFFLFFKKRVAYAIMVSGILTLLVVHLFKKVFFLGILRPAGFFGEENMHLVEGVKMAYTNSFPSGHTATAFAIFTIVCFYFSKSKSQYFWITLSILIGISRVYLSQHYWIDIFVGSILGIFIGFLSMSFFYKIKKIHKC